MWSWYFSTSDCSATRELYSYVLGYGGLFSFRRAQAGLRCSCLPQADGTATLYKAVIDLIARTMQYSAALGNRPRDVGEGLGLHVTSTLPHRATQRCKLSLSWLQRGVFNGVFFFIPTRCLQWCTMVYSSSFGLLHMSPEELKNYFMDQQVITSVDYYNYDLSVK